MRNPFQVELNSLPHQALSMSHNAVADGMKGDFDCVKSHTRTVLSMVVWSADQTRAGSPKKRQVPIVTMAARTGLELATARENRDHSQLTLLRVISALGASVSRLFLSKTKTFEKNL
jgi:hypothetical protein